MTEPDQPLFVVAATLAGATNWARAHGIPAGRWRFVTKTGDNLRGQRRPPVVLVPGWTSFRSAEQETATRQNLDAAQAYYVDHGSPSRLDLWRPQLRPMQSFRLKKDQEDE
jgi:hypothetical protein